LQTGQKGELFLYLKTTESFDYLSFVTSKLKTEINSYAKTSGVWNKCCVDNSNVWT